MSRARRKLWMSRGFLALGLLLGFWLVHEPGTLNVQDRTSLLLFMPGVCLLGIMLWSGRSRYVIVDPVQEFMTEAELQAEFSRYPPLIRFALEALREHRGDKVDLRPPLHRLLWRIGVPAPPFTFGHFGWNLLVMGGWMFLAVPFWLFLYAMVRQSQGVPADDHDVHMVKVVAGAITFVIGVVALLMSADSRSEAQSAGMPTWRELKARFRSRPGGTFG